MSKEPQILHHTAKLSEGDSGRSSQASGWAPHCIAQYNRFS